METRHEKWGGIISRREAYEARAPDGAPGCSGVGCAGARATARQNSPIASEG
jgi:hypothetical protein